MERLLVGFLLVTAACAPSSETAPSSAHPSTPSSDSKSSLKLYAFDCGRMHYDSVAFLGFDNSETDVRDLVVPCYVIEHEKGRLLWEGGLPSSYAATDGWHEMEGGWRMRLDRPFAEQIAEMGWSMSDFDFVAFSHFHFDHVGVANEVKGATLLIQRAEYDDAFAEEVTIPGFEPDVYGGLRELETLVVDGEHDVFGDRRVRLIAAPGHTAGHQVLFVDLETTGPVVLSGDLYVFRLGYEQGRILPIDRFPELSAESMGQVEALLEATGAELWIGHEAAHFDQLEKPPEFHD